MKLAATRGSLAVHLSRNGGVCLRRLDFRSNGTSCNYGRVQEQAFNHDTRDQAEREEKDCRAEPLHFPEDCSFEMRISTLRGSPRREYFRVVPQASG